MQGQALADRLLLALASHISGNQNSFSDGVGWDDHMQKSKFRENNTSMALFSLCYELYIFYQLFSHGPQQVGRRGPFFSQESYETAGAEVRGRPPNTQGRSGSSCRVRAASGMSRLWGTGFIHPG